MVANTVSSTANSSATDHSIFIRRAFQGDAVVSGLSGLLLLFGSDVIARFIGLPDASGALLMLGVFFLLWAGLNLWVSTRPTITRLPAFTVIEGNLLYAIGSVVLLLGGWLPLSTAGMWAVAIGADIVAILAILQYVGWRRMNAG